MYLIKSMHTEAINDPAITMFQTGSAPGRPTSAGSLKGRSGNKNRPPSRDNSRKISRRATALTALG